MTHEGKVVFMFLDRGFLFIACRLSSTNRVSIAYSRLKVEQENFIVKSISAVNVMNSDYSLHLKLHDVALAGQFSYQHLEMEPTLGSQLASSCSTMWFITSSWVPWLLFIA